VRGHSAKTHGANSPIAMVESLGDVGPHASVIVGQTNIYQHPASPVRSDEPPKLSLTEWGPIPDDHIHGVSVGQTGFKIVNDGTGAAYDITIEDFDVGIGVSAKSKTLSRVEGGRGTAYAFVWLDGYSSLAIDTRKWDLLGAMKQAALAGGEGLYRPDYSVPVSVIYRDSSDNWSRTFAPLTFIRSQNCLEIGAPRYSQRVRCDILARSSTSNRPAEIPALA
jgi:hypothetical protein